VGDAKMADASGKAALTRAPSKTGRFFGGVDAREASWSSAERQFRFGPQTGLTAIEEFCLTPLCAFHSRQLIGKEGRPTRSFLENPIFKFFLLSPVKLTGIPQKRAHQTVHLHYSSWVPFLS